MLRTLILAAAIATCLPAMPQADTTAGANVEQSIQGQFWHVLRLDELMQIMQQEAVSEAASIQELIDERGGDKRWIKIVRQIHEPARLKQLFDAGVEGSYAGSDPELLATALDFYRTPLGRKMLGLEVSAREVLLDDDAEADAHSRFARAVSETLPRTAQIRRLIEEADLLGPNVAGGMNAALAFARGFEEGGGYTVPMSEAEMLSDAWAQEPVLRAETLGWLEAYLYLAYAPLTDDELNRYIDFASSDAGQALAKTLFAGFDTMFNQTSYEMGRAAAGQLQGRRL